MFSHSPSIKLRRDACSQKGKLRKSKNMNSSSQIANAYNAKSAIIFTLLTFLLSISLTANQEHQLSARRVLEQQSLLLMQVVLKAIGCPGHLLKLISKPIQTSVQTCTTRSSQKHQYLTKRTMNCLKVDVKRVLKLAHLLLLISMSF